MTSILNWIANYGQYVGFIVQIVFYVILAVAALWATLLFRQLVHARVGAPGEPAHTESPGETVPPATPEGEEASVSEFVE
jgi:hypothetical protein